MEILDDIRPTKDNIAIQMNKFLASLSIDKSNIKVEEFSRILSDSYENIVNHEQYKNENQNVPYEDFTASYIFIVAPFV